MISLKPNFAHSLEAHFNQTSGTSKYLFCLQNFVLKEKKQNVRDIWIALPWAQFHIKEVCFKWVSSMIVWFCHQFMLKYLITLCVWCVCRNSTDTWIPWQNILTSPKWAGPSENGPHTWHIQTWSHSQQAWYWILAMFVCTVWWTEVLQSVQTVCVQL